jgi:hypothetical protein
MGLVTAPMGEAKAGEWNAGFIRQQFGFTLFCRMNPAFRANPHIS